MNNIKTFKQHKDNQENLNENLGKDLIQWAKRTFKPEELDDLIVDIIRQLKTHDFDVDRLKITAPENGYSYYKYPIGSNTIKVSILDYNKPKLMLNNTDVTEYVDNFYIRKIYKFFKEKYNKEDKERELKKLRDVRKNWRHTS